MQPDNLPEPVKSVDEQIAAEWSATHPISGSTQHSHLSDIIETLQSAFRYHKMIAIPATLGVILITGTATALVARPSGEGQTTDETISSRSDDREHTYSYEDAMAKTEDSRQTTPTTTGSSAQIPVLSPTTPSTPGTPRPSSAATNSADNGDDTLSYDPPEPQEPGPVVVPNVPDDSPDNPPVTNPDTPTGSVNNSISIVSFNYAHWKPAEGVDSAVRKLSEYADIVGFQEFGPSDSRNVLSRVVNQCSSCGYGLYMPDISSGGNIPIIWKKNKFQVLSKGNVKVYDSQRVEDGAGGPNVTAKHLTWLRLKDKTSGRVFWIVNNHLIPSVEANGRPNPNKPQRVALYSKHMNKLTDKVNQFKQNNTPVFITGDFNVNYHRDSVVRASVFPYSKMNTINAWANWRYLGAPASGSNDEGNRLIDYVFATKNDKVIPRSARVLPQYGSDHHAVEMVVRIK